jgi:hypothetical protein
MLGKDVRTVQIYLKKKEDKVGGPVYPISRLFIELRSSWLCGTGRGWTHRSMEQDGELRNRSTQRCPSDFWQKYKSHSVKEREPFQQMVLE